MIRIIGQGETLKFSCHPGQHATVTLSYTRAATTIPLGASDYLHPVPVTPQTFLLQPPRVPPFTQGQMLPCASTHDTPVTLASGGDLRVYHIAQ